jgi:hypothetical protein
MQLRTKHGSKLNEPTASEHSQNVLAVGTVSWIIGRTDRRRSPNSLPAIACTIASCSYLHTINHRREPFNRTTVKHNG